MDDGLTKIIVFAGAGLVALLVLVLRHIFRSREGRSKVPSILEPAWEPVERGRDKFQEEAIPRGHAPLIEDPPNVGSAQNENWVETERAPKTSSKRHRKSSVGSVLGNIVLFLMFGPFAIIFFLIRNSLRKTKEDDE